MLKVSSWPKPAFLQTKKQNRRRCFYSPVTFILIASSASTASAGSRFDLVFTQPARWCGSSDQVAKGAQCGPGSVAGGNYGLLVRHRSAVASGKHAGMLVQTRLFISSLQSASASPCPWAYRVLGRDAFQRLLLHRPSRSQHQTIAAANGRVAALAKRSIAGPFIAPFWAPAPTGRGVALRPTARQTGVPGRRLRTAAPTCVAGCQAGRESAA